MSCGEFGVIISIVLLFFDLFWFWRIVGVWEGVFDCDRVFVFVFCVVKVGDRCDV